MCDDHGVAHSVGLKKLPTYCDMHIGMQVRTMDAWEVGDLDEFCAQFAIDFKRTDERQRMYTVEYLSALKAKGCTSSDDLHQFARKYKAVSSVLLKNGLITSYLQCSWFLETIPVDVRRRVVTHCGISAQRPESFKFNAVFNFVSSSLDTENTMAALATPIQQPTGEMKQNVVKDNRPIVQPMANNDRMIDELSNRFSAMIMPLSARLDGLEGKQPSQPNTQRQVQFNTRPTIMNPSQPTPPNRNCYYCGQMGHGVNDCADKATDIENGRIHIIQDYKGYPKICLGPVPVPNERWIALSNDRPQREQIMEMVRARQPTVTNAPISVASIMEEDAWDEPVSVFVKKQLRLIEEGPLDEEDWVEVQAKRVAEENPIDYRFADAARIIKKRRTAEGDLPTFKHPVQKTKQPTAEELGIRPTDDRIASAFDKLMTDAPPIVEKPEENEAKTTKKRLEVVLKGEANATDMLEKIISTPVEGITVREILALAPSLRNLFFKAQPVNTNEQAQLKKTPVPVAKLGAVRTCGADRPVLYASATPKVKVSLNDECEVIAMLDTSAEINVMVRSIAEAGGLPIRTNPRLALISYGQAAHKFVGVCEDVIVAIGGVKTKTAIFVVEEAHADHTLILGRPFFKTAGGMIDESSGRCVLMLMDDYGERTISVNVTKASDTNDKLQADIFPLNDELVL